MERFRDEILERLAAVREIQLETVGRRTGVTRRTTMWVVVDEGIPYVRSEFGDAGQWYRNALADPHVGLVFDGRRHDAIATPVTEQAQWSRVSNALRAKYGHSGSLAIMVRPEVEPMTLALDPARQA
jgi:deazaflavin-dependent oxidoreductase (nitroreductase family)